MSKVRWIEGLENGCLAICPRPRGGEDLLDSLLEWRSSEADVVVSLLSWMEESLLELDQESAICDELGLKFLSCPIPDRGIPASAETFFEIVEVIRSLLRTGQKVVIHCRMGIGRSALLAACILVLEGYDSEEAFATIGNARGTLVPDTDEQRRWVETFRLRFFNDRTN